MTFENYSYDGTLKRLSDKKKNDNDTSNKTGTGYDEFEEILQNKMNIIKDDPDARYNKGLALGDPETADIRIVGLGYSGSGNSSLMLRLFYNEYNDEPEDNALLQWEQHQMNYKNKNTNNNTANNTFRISYFDLKGFDDILSKSDMEERIDNTINDSFNVILLYYSIDNRTSFEDSNGYSVQDIKLCVDRCLEQMESGSAQFMLVLVGLKSDTDIDGQRKVSATEAQNLATNWGVPFVEVSAKTGQGIQKLLHILCNIDGENNVVENATVIQDEKCIEAIDNENQRENINVEIVEDEKENKLGTVSDDDVDNNDTIGSDDQNTMIENETIEQDEICNDYKDKETEIVNDDIESDENDENDEKEKETKTTIISRDNVIGSGDKTDNIRALNTMDKTNEQLIDKKTSMTEPLIPVENKGRKKCCVIL